MHYELVTIKKIAPSDTVLTITRQFAHHWRKLSFWRCSSAVMPALSWCYYCKTWQPSLCNHLNVLNQLLHLIWARQPDSFSRVVRKKQNLWARLCNQWQPGVFCVSCLLGEWALLTDYHETPCCYTEAWLWGSHGFPSKWNRIVLCCLLLNPPHTQTSAHVLDSF